MTKSINLNHETSTIYTNGDSILSLTTQGAIRIGNGKNFESLASSFPGIVRYNEDINEMQISDGTNWVKLGSPVDAITSFVWAIVF